MNSDDRTTILPANGAESGARSGASGRPGGRAARRAAQRHAERPGGRARRAGRRGPVGPVAAVAAAVAGTGLLAALVGAGYAAYGGKQADRDATGQALAADAALIAAEAGTHDGIQVPGAGGAGPDVAAPPVTPAATDPAPAPTSAAATTPAAPASPTAPATATPTRTATGRPSPSTPVTAPAKSAGTPAAAQRTGAPAPTSASAPTPVGGGAAPSSAQQVVDLVNVERAKAGCGPVSAEPRLAGAAQSHSDDMADRNYFDHASPDGDHADHRIEVTGYRWSTWGENIARGQKDPAAVMDSWMNSPGHRANILNCAFKQLGVGVRTGSGGPWWTQVFAAPA
ncbi:CAP domain-containing protein [Kitasatospora sp. NPDC091276]|uniref:CAP domain-containing protein n=1 Tax=Kitasatospora sp. NPDC091276 TaxID=3155300 RepID=UPI00341501C0